MKLIDDLKAAAKNGSHMQGLRNDVVLLLCEAVEALDAVDLSGIMIHAFEGDGLSHSEEQVRRRAVAALDDLRSYAP